MRFFFDKCLSPYLVKGLRGFDEDVVHLTQCLPKDTKDIPMLAYVAEQGMVLVTADKGIRRNPAERAALRECKVGAFFLQGKAMGRWQRIRQVVSCWERMKELAEKTQRPFAFVVRRGGGIKPLSLGG
jgi:hypothetical protein